MADIRRTPGGLPIVRIADSQGRLHDYTLAVVVRPVARWSCRLIRLGPEGEVEKEYLVQFWPAGNWTCTCPDWRMRRRQTGRPCKHLIALADIHDFLRGLSP